MSGGPLRGLAALSCYGPDGEGGFDSRPAH